MSDWQVIGRQRFRVEGDTLYWELQGDITAPEILRVFDEGLVVQAKNGYTLLLITCVAAWTFPPEARSALAQFHRENKAVGVTAVVGASPSMRMFVDLVLRAIALVTGSRPTTRFFRTWDEALAWLAEERAVAKQGLLTR